MRSSKSVNLCSLLKSRPLEVVFEDKYSAWLKVVKSTMPYILVRSSLNPGFGGPTYIDYHSEVGVQGEFRLLDAIPYLRAKCIHGCFQGGACVMMSNRYGRYGHCTSKLKAIQAKTKSQ